jgi:hypothetical protein
MELQDQLVHREALEAQVLQEVPDHKEALEAQARKAFKE